MFKKLLAALGRQRDASADLPAPDAPYPDSGANAIYQLLFADNAALFKPRANEIPAPWQQTLYADAPDLVAIAALAADPVQEGRIRFLAWSRLRELGAEVPAKSLLGVVIEVPLPGGLDVLAAYVDGSVRYVNQSGKLLFIEGAAVLRPLIDDLLTAAKAVIERIGPWTDPRLSPPHQGNVRMTFLVSDGLYFGEGPMDVIGRDGMGGPVMGAATALLQKAVGMAVPEGAA